MNISTFEYKEIDIEMTYNNRFLAYTFEKGGKTYGGKVELKSKKIMDIASTSFLLLVNAIETYELLCEQKNLKNNLKN